MPTSTFTRRKSRCAGLGLLLLFASASATAHAAPPPEKADPAPAPTDKAPPADKATSAPVPEKPSVSPDRREPTAGNLATARSALREGLTLRDKGDFDKAIARLGTAYDLVPTPVTGFELGKTHLMAGHVLQAHELFKKVDRMPPSLEESTRSQTSRDEATRLAKEIEPRIPSLRLRIKLPPGASAVVRVGDEIVSMSGTEMMRAVDPGRHEIFAKAGDGPEQKVTVTLAEGETKDVELSPQWVKPKEPDPATQGKREFYVKQTNPLTIVGFAAASAALVWTGISAILLQNAASDLKEACGSDEFCSPDIRREEGAPVALWAISTLIGAGATVAFFTMGLVAFNRPVSQRVVAGSVTPVVGLGGAGLVGRF